MAGKMPPGAGGWYPPPPYQQQPPQPATHTTVVVQGAPRTVVHQKPGTGLFGSIVREVNLAGNQIGREIDRVGVQINQSVDTSASSPLLSQFQTGNVIQLVSRMSGKPLQILSGHNGQLVVDANPMDPRGFNTMWTVVNEGCNQVRLHNNNNYLTIVNGNTTLVQMPPGTMHGVETKWQLSLMQNFVLLESLKERGRHIGILPGGALKPALVCTRESAAQFGVQLMSTANPHAQVASGGGYVIMK